MICLHVLFPPKKKKKLVHTGSRTSSGFFEAACAALGRSRMNSIKRRWPLLGWSTNSSAHCAGLVRRATCIEGAYAQVAREGVKETGWDVMTVRSRKQFIRSPTRLKLAQYIVWRLEATEFHFWGAALPRWTWAFLYRQIYIHILQKTIYINIYRHGWIHNIAHLHIYIYYLVTECSKSPYPPLWAPPLPTYTHTCPRILFPTSRFPLKSKGLGPFSDSAHLSSGSRWRRSWSEKKSGGNATRRCILSMDVIRR